MRRVAIESIYCDEFSVEYLDVKDGVDLKGELEKWKKWYENEYCPALEAWYNMPNKYDHLNLRPQYYTFTEGLIKLGLAVENTDIEIFEVD